MKTVSIFAVILALGLMAYPQTSFKGNVSLNGNALFGPGSSCGPPTYSCMNSGLSVVPFPTQIPIWGTTNTAVNNPTYCASSNPYLFQQCGNLAGAGTIQTPTDFNQPIIRCTDANTSGYQGYWGTRDNGEPNIFGADDSWLSVHGGGATGTLDPILYFTGSSCGLTGISYAYPQAVQADHTHPQYVYPTAGTNKQQLWQDTLPIPLASCAPICTQPAGSNHVELFDFIYGCVSNGTSQGTIYCASNPSDASDSFNRLRNPYNGNTSWTPSGSYATGLLTSSADDNTFMLGFADNTGSNYVAVWRRSYGINGGCDIWNVATGTLWKHDGSCNSVTPCNFTFQQTTGSPAPDEFTFHEAFVDPSGTYGFVDTSSQALMIQGTYAEGPYIWQIGTTNIVGKCGTTSPTNYCTGHFGEGYAGLAVGQQWHAPFSSPNSGTNMFSGSITTTCADSHFSWNHVDTGTQTDDYPVLIGWQDEGSTYNLLGSGTPPCPYYDEIDFTLASGLGAAGTTHRAAHQFNTGWSPSFEPQNAIAIQSSSGKYIAFPSDGWGQFGSTGGTAACNIGGPDWQKSDSSHFTVYSGSGAGVFGNFIAPASHNAGNYIFAVQSCSGSPCATGSSEPTFPQTGSATVTETGTGNITWVNTGNIQNCRSDILIVKTF